MKKNGVPAFVYKSCRALNCGCYETALQEILFLGSCYTFCYASVTWLKYVSFSYNHLRVKSCMLKFIECGRYDSFSGMLN